MAQLTIEELARQSGCTTRNIRNYQTRGLLPPPTVTGRTGYYDEGHLGRLRLIANLQARGYSLAAIADVVRAWQDRKSVRDILGFEQALTEPWESERPERVPVDAILAQFPEAAEDDTLIERVVDMGLVAVEGNEVVLLRPRLVSVGADLVAAGVPLSAALDELETLAEAADRIAARFVALFDQYVWEPFEASGMPSESLPEVTATLARMRPLAVRAAETAIAAAMHERVSQRTVERVAHLVPVDDSEAAG